MAGRQKQTNKKTDKISPKISKRMVVKKRAKRKAGSVCERPRRTCVLNGFRRSNSVELISVKPCCTDDEDRRKYDLLGLNTALFCSKPTPPKRRQSHISVITVSSSDEEIGQNRVSEWLDSMDVDNNKHVCNEEAYIGDVDPINSESRIVQVSEAEEIRQQMSLLKLPSIYTEDVGPRCISSVDMFRTKLLPKSKEPTTTDEATSAAPEPSPFLINPFRSNDRSVMTDCHTVWSTISQAIVNYDNVSRKERFFFGSHQNLDAGSENVSNLQKALTNQRVSSDCKISEALPSTSSGVPNCNKSQSDD